MRSPYPFIITLIALLQAGCAISGGNRWDRPSLSGELADRVEIERLVIEFSYLLDHGQGDRVANLFAPDAVFENPGTGLRAVGRGAIAEYYARRARDPRTTRHVSTNLHLRFETPDRAIGTRLITYYRGDGSGPPFPAEPGSVGEYKEIFVRTPDGKWRFAFRRNELMFRSSALSCVTSEASEEDDSGSCVEKCRCRADGVLEVLG